MNWISDVPSQKVKHVSRTPLSRGSGIYWIKSKKVMNIQAAWKSNAHSQFTCTAAKSPLPQVTAESKRGNFQLVVWVTWNACTKEEGFWSLRVQLRSGSEGEGGKESLPVINFHFARREMVCSFYTDAQTVANSFTGWSGSWRGQDWNHSNQFVSGHSSLS